MTPSSSTSFSAAARSPRYWPLWSALGLLRALTWLPWPMQRGLGRALGALLPLLAKSRHAVARDNLQKVYPTLSDAEREDVLGAHMSALGIGLFQAAVAWWARDARIMRLIDVSGLEHLSTDDGRPEILVGVHHTNMEMLLRGLGACARFSALHRPFRHPVIDPIMHRGRLRGVVSLIDKRKAKALPRAMREGRRVYIAADQVDTTNSAVVVPFLGHLARTNTTVARLAARYQARVVPVHAHLKKDGRFSIVVHPPLALSHTNEEEDTRRLNAAFEQLIAVAPPQYYWVHRRFRGDVS